MAELTLRQRNRRAAMADVQRVAVQLMRADGFGNVTVEQVAEEAGVSPSTAYRYFGTKEALVLWGDRSEQLVAALEAGAAGGAAATPLFTDAALDVYTADEADLLDRLQLVFANEPLAVAFEHALLGRRAEVATAFARARGAGSVGVRDDAAAGALLGMLLAMLTRWQAGGGSKSLAKLIVKGTDSLSG